jgi:hypothetical protein
MRALVVIDALSHWCLLAMDGVDSLAQLGVPVEIVLAPVAEGKPMGTSREKEAWFYTRGTLAHGRVLRSDWCEGEQTSTWHANAAVLAGAEVNGDLAGTLRAVMRAAMEDGKLFGCASDVRAFVAELTGTNLAEIDRRCEDPSLAQRLHDGNRRLTELGADERPTFSMLNDNGDFAVLKGLWQRNAVMACAQALLSDERAYAAAGVPPP